MTKASIKHHAMHDGRKLLAFLDRNKESCSPLLILTHDYPDPDTLASAYSLATIAEKRFGMTTRIAYGGVIGRMENRNMVRILHIPVHKIRPFDFKKYAHVALLDTQPDFANNSFPKNKKATLIIDQHPFVKKPSADLVIIDPDCGATSVILAQALLHAHIDIPAPVATALAYGILSDTLNLYRAGRPDILQTYLSILRHCDLRALAKIQNPQRSRKFFSTLGKGIQNAMVRRGMIVSHLGVVENPDLVSQIADYLLTYKGMQKSLCTGRYKGKLHVSLRIATPNAEAGEILRDVFEDRGEAGGHGGVAGGSFKVGLQASEETWQETEQSVAQRLAKRFRLPAKGDFYYPFR